MDTWDWGEDRIDLPALWRGIAGSGFWLAVLTVAVLVVAVVAFAHENAKLIPPNPDAAAHYTQEPGNPLTLLTGWDGRDYMDIARHGYTDSAQTNFFPLYPLLARYVGAVVGSPLTAAVLLSWAGAVGGLYYYLRIIKLLYGTTDNLEALRAGLLWVLFPTGVFLLGVYTEGLFSLFALGALYCALGGKSLEAAALLAVCTAMHVTGLFVLAAAVLLLWERRRELSIPLLRLVSVAAIGLVGILSYMVWLAGKYDNPFEFIVSQQSHGWLTAGSYGHGLLVWLAGRKGLFVLLALVAVWYWWRRRVWYGRAFAMYSLLFVLIVSLGNLGGYGRYAVTDFPIMFMLYDALRARSRTYGYSLVLAASAACWMYFVLQYTRFYSGG